MRGFLVALRAFRTQWRSARKRGNRFSVSFRDRLIMAFRMAGAARMVAKGPPYTWPRWVKR